MNIKKLTVFALAALFCTTGLALATKSDTTHIRVSAKVDASCVNFTVGNLTFGTLPALPPYAVQSSNTTAISYQCTLGTNVELQARGNCTDPSDSGTGWAMCDNSGHYVDFAFYMAGSEVSGCGPSTSNQEYPNTPFSDFETDGTYIDAGSGYTDATQSLCAQIPTNPSPSTGAIYVGDGHDHYNDRVTLTLIY